MAWADGYWSPNQEAVARFTSADLQADIPMKSCLLLRRNAKVSVEHWREDKRSQDTGNGIKIEQSTKIFFGGNSFDSNTCIPKGKLLCQFNWERVSRLEVCEWYSSQKHDISWHFALLHKSHCSEIKKYGERKKKVWIHLPKRKTLLPLTQTSAIFSNATELWLVERSGYLSVDQSIDLCIISLLSIYLMTWKFSQFAIPHNEILQVQEAATVFLIVKYLVPADRECDSPKVLN